MKWFNKKAYDEGYKAGKNKRLEWLKAEADHLQKRIDCTYAKAAEDLKKEKAEWENIKSAYVLSVLKDMKIETSIKIPALEELK